MQTETPEIPSMVASLKDLMALLTATYLVHWNSHWKASGPTAYSDHLLFERLYTGVQEEIDTLAEKLSSGLVDIDVPHAEMIALAATYVAEWERSYPDIVSRSAHAEEVLQQRLHSDYAALESSNSLPLGLNDFLGGAANTHDTHCYLLHRRMLEKQYFGEGQ